MEINWALIFSFRCIKYCRDYHHYRIKRHVVSVSSVECRPGGRLCERTYTRYTWCSAKFISFFSSSANTCERASDRARTTNVWIVHSTSQRSYYSNHIKEMPNCCHSIAFRVFSSHHFMIFIFLRRNCFSSETCSPVPFVASANYVLWKWIRWRSLAGRWRSRPKNGIVQQSTRLDASATCCGLHGERVPFLHSSVRRTTTHIRWKNKKFARFNSAERWRSSLDGFQYFFQSASTPSAHWRMSPPALIAITFNRMIYRNSNKMISPPIRQSGCANARVCQCAICAIHRPQRRS